MRTMLSNHSPSNAGGGGAWFLMSFDIGVTGGLPALVGLFDDFGLGVSLPLDLVLGRDRGTAKFSLFSSRSVPRKNIIK